MAILTTITQTPEKALEEAKVALATAEAAAVEEIAKIILQLPNYCLKENYEMGVYISSLSLKDHIKPHNSKIHDALPIIFVGKGNKYLDNVICNNEVLNKTIHILTYSDAIRWLMSVDVKIDMIDLNGPVDAAMGVDTARKPISIIFYISYVCIHVKST